jgi:hypothetical protein
VISSRFAGATALLLGLASVPTARHSYLGAKVDDGLTVRAIPTVLGGRPFTPTGRKVTWAKDTLDSEDWLERTYRDARGDVLLFVARSFDAKRLYHHPELALLRGMETTPAGRAHLPRRPDVPIHVLKTSQAGRTGVGVYALLYDGTFVERPILFQARTAVTLLFGGQRAMTLFLAADLSGSVHKLEAATASTVLLDAIEAFERQNAAHPG